MRNLRSIHRITMLVVVLPCLFLACTGTFIQVIDFHSILAGVPASDPNIRAMREGFSGPPNFQVIRPSDYTAPVLTDLSNPFSSGAVIHEARKQLNGRPIDYVEVRAGDSGPVAYAQSKKDLIAISITTGSYVGTTIAPPPEKAPPDALRNQVKNLHKFLFWGKRALAINYIVLTGLATLVITGLWLYWTVYAVRRSKLHKPAPFWSAGGFWRSFHRHVSLVASLFILIIAITGTEITYETLHRQQYEIDHPKIMPSGKTEFVDAREVDKSSPLSDSELPTMWQVVSESYQREFPGVGARAVRLRNFAGIPQGVVISGAREAEQLVFSAKTGAVMGQYEAGYPPTGFPFGWRIHQLAKNIHRGDIIGLPGRTMSLIGGLSLIYLSLSGIYMYWQMWRNRRQVGQGALIWT
jgi:uncharacterized iron-regulated membrane protein